MNYPGEQETVLTVRADLTHLRRQIVQESSFFTWGLATWLVSQSKGKWYSLKGRER